MAASTIEVLLKFTGDPRNAKEAIAQVRADLTKSAQEQVKTTKDVNKQVTTEAKNQTKTLEKEERDRLKAAESLQRQRSAALIRIWREELREKQRIEKEKEKAEKGGADFTLLLNNVPVLRGLTSQFSSLSTESAGAGTAIAGVAGAIGIVVAGAAIGIGVLAKLGAEIFDLTKKLAAFQGKFFDLSQQVGVSVETLSTLDVIASTTGGNIDTVAASLGIFQRNLQDAHDPTSKEAKLLKELGVTSLDTETALRQTIKGLFDLKDTGKQTDAVLQLFGRSGRFVNAILKESKGDIDAAARAFGGLQVSRDAAAAADAFNDSLEILNRTLARVGANLVTNTIPIFTVFFQDLNKALTGNKDDWSSWSRFIEVEVAGVLGTLQGLKDVIASGGTLDPFIAIDVNISSLLKRAKEARLRTAAETATEQAQRAVALAKGLAGRPGDRPDADKANTDARQRAAKALALEQQALEERTRSHRQAMERERDLELKNIEEWEEASIKLASDHNEAQLKLLKQEEDNANRFIANAADRLLALREIDQKRIKATNQLVEELQRIETLAQKKRDDTDLKTVERLFKITEAERKGRLDLIRRAGVEESELLRQQQLSLEQQHTERITLLSQERDALSTTASRQTEIRDQLKAVETDYTNEFLELSAKRMKALADEAAARQPAPGGPVQIPGQIPINVGLPPPESLDATVRLATEAGGVFAGLGTIMSDTFNLGAGGALAFAETLSSAFGQVSSAVGDMVRSFVLFGSVEGGFRRFASEVIASLAAMAVTQALYQAAQGLAWLALNFFFPNPRYALAASTAFASAAAFGAIAAVTVPLGRAFSQQGGNAFQSAGAGGGGGSTSPSVSNGQPPPVVLDRTTQNQQAITLLVNVKRDAGSIVEVVVDDHRSNGPIRQMILSER